MLDKTICIIKEHDVNVGLRCSRNECKHKYVIEAAGFKPATPLEYGIQKIVD